MPTRRSRHFVRLRSQILIPRGDVGSPVLSPQPLQPERERLAPVDPRRVSAAVYNSTRRRAWTVCAQRRAPRAARSASTSYKTVPSLPPRALTAPQGSWHAASRPDTHSIVLKTRAALRLGRAHTLRHSPSLRELPKSYSQRRRGRQRGVSVAVRMRLGGGRTSSSVMRPPPPQQSSTSRTTSTPTPRAGTHVASGNKILVARAETTRAAARGCVPDAGLLAFLVQSAECRGARLHACLHAEQLIAWRQTGYDSYGSAALRSARGALRCVHRDQARRLVQI